MNDYYFFEGEEIDINVTRKKISPESTINFYVGI